MRSGAVILLVLATLPGPTRFLSVAKENRSLAASPDRLPRSPYLLRQIFGDFPQSAPAIWGVTPGIRHNQIPAKVDLGKELWSAESPASFLREVAGLATVVFVFEGRDPQARLDHVTVTVFESPRVTRKALLTHLGRIYGPVDASVSGGPEDAVGSWQGGAVLLRDFPPARFFEVTLSLHHSPPE